MVGFDDLPVATWVGPTLTRCASRSSRWRWPLPASSPAGERGGAVADTGRACHRAHRPREHGTAEPLTPPRPTRAGRPSGRPHWPATERRSGPWSNPIVTGPYEDNESVPLRFQPVVARPDGWRGVPAASSRWARRIRRCRARPRDGIRRWPAASHRVPRSPGQPVTSAAPSPTAVLRPPETRPLPSNCRASRSSAGDPDRTTLVDGYGLMRLDLATGELAQLATPLDYTAQFLPSGEIACACIVRDPAANDGRGSAILRFGRYDPAGQPISTRPPILRRDGRRSRDGRGINVVTGHEPGGHRLYALAVERRPPSGPSPCSGSMSRPARSSTRSTSARSRRTRTATIRPRPRQPRRRRRPSMARRRTARTSGPRT